MYHTSERHVWKCSQCSHMLQRHISSTAWRRPIPPLRVSVMELNPNSLHLISSVYEQNISAHLKACDGVVYVCLSVLMSAALWLRAENWTETSTSLGSTSLNI